MPNWCSNNLIVIGDETELSKLREKAKTKESPLSLNKLYPIPKPLRDTTSPSEKENIELIKKYGFDNWYNWCVSRWGTKWDLDSSSEVEYFDNYLEYDFSSAWSPPIQAFTHISKKYPNLIFFLRYYEGGVGFYGLCKIKNGKAEEMTFDFN